MRWWCLPASGLGYGTCGQPSLGSGTSGGPAGSLGNLSGAGTSHWSEYM